MYRFTMYLVGIRTQVSRTVTNSVSKLNGFGTTIFFGNDHARLSGIA